MKFAQLTMIVGLATAMALPIPDVRAASADNKSAPARVEPIAGTAIKRVTLTQKAAQRLDVRTGPIGRDDSGKKIVPFAAVFYDLTGEAWVYTVPEPLTYVRQKLVVETINGERAFVREGPAEGTQVVIAGVAEIYGTERGVGH